MQAARIWFRQSNPRVTLSRVRDDLHALGAEVEETEWRLGAYVVPQLLIVSPIACLAQLEDDDWVIEEVEDFASRAPAEMCSRLSQCDARLSFGGADDERAVTTDRGTFVQSGWTDFDPSEPTARALLQALARRIDGLLEDNTLGTWWTAS